jgi:XTP/dITP diphosphohydrolase
VRFVLATANAGKAREIADVLRGAGVDDLELVPRPDGVPDVEETGTTLEDNARLKAVALCEATGLPAIADDTGLLVDALGGAPGVRSARFAGEHATDARNVAKLLDLLRDVGPGHRTARFATVALARFPDGREVAAFGDVEGTIAPEPRGELGFGYDPVFVPDEGDGRTFAQLRAEDKNSLSHRGRAFRTLADGLRMVAALEEQQ